MTISVTQAAEQRTSNRATRPERRGVTRRSVIEEAKAKVSVAELANHLASEAGSRWRRSGGEWVTNCPLPDHPDKTPSFSVNTEDGVWFCYGCLRGGDSVELARFAWGYSKDEVPMAAAEMLDRFGHEIPPWPAARQRKQERQAATCNAIEHTRKGIARRRLFETLILPHIQAIENEAERNRELERAWSDFRRLLP